MAKLAMCGAVAIFLVTAHYWLAACAACIIVGMCATEVIDPEREDEE